MKKHLFLLCFLVLVPFVFQQCKKDKDENIVPDNLKVGVTDAISFPDLDKKKALQFDNDILSGADIYQALRTLVYIADYASDKIQGTLDFIRTQDISGPVAFSYTSNDDLQTKYLEVQQKVTYDNTTYDFGLTITDETEGKAFLLVWNRSPLKAVAILHPVAYDAYSIVYRNALLKVEYSEGSANYDRSMIVSISGLDSLSIGYISRLKVFFGQKGDIVSLYGNYNMPNTSLMDPASTQGRSWCFIAKNNTRLDIAVARISMPTVTVDQITNLWTDYALEKVLEEEILSVYPTMDTATMETYINSAIGNAYFVGASGYVSNNDVIPDKDGFTSDFMDLSGLEPWPPALIETMTIDF